MKGYLAASLFGLVAAWFIFGMTAGPMVDTFDAVKFQADVDTRVPDTVEAKPELPLSAEESKTFKLFERFCEAREQKIADAIIAQADGKKSQVIAGSILAGAIAYAIKAIVTALIYTLIVTVLIALFWKYAVWIGLVYVITVLLPAWFAGSWAGRRAGK